MERTPCSAWIANINGTNYAIRTEHASKLMEISQDSDICTMTTLSDGSFGFEVRSLGQRLPENNFLKSVIFERCELINDAPEDARSRRGTLSEDEVQAALKALDNAPF